MTKVAITGALAGAFAAMASGASAQQIGENPPVEIRNNSGEERKICFHKPKRVTLFPIGCVTLKDGENIFWNRKGSFTPFKVKVYKKRKLVDKYLYARDLPGDTAKILVGQGGRFGFSLFKNIRKSYYVRVCNTTQDEKVWVALGYDTTWGKVSEGWWSLAKGECKTIDPMARFNEVMGRPLVDPPRVYYHARTYGEEPKTWGDGILSREFCINQSKKFDAHLTGNGVCKEGQKIAKYRFLGALAESGQTGFTFQF